MGANLIHEDGKRISDHLGVCIKGQNEISAEEKGVGGPGRDESGIPASELIAYKSD
jgi:hypothetical protein